MLQENFILFLLIFLVLLILVFLVFKKTNTKDKISALKKEELIKQYEYEMLKIVSKYEKDKKLLSKKKIEFLKTASHELHNNIFFEETEAKSIVKKLAQM